MRKPHTNCKEPIYHAHTRLLSKLKENVVKKKERKRKKEPFLLSILNNKYMNHRIYLNLVLPYVLESR